ncbi:MAG: DUF1761 domain-containing protein [Candidatus Pacebacteria bacterium]|nr:DUF1761 domain-containing protein [Candidatus Paceibacterota bacterium]
MDVPVNYMAVVACAIAAMIIGYVWYGPLFGKKWAHMSGVSLERMQKGGGKSYAIMFVGSLITAYTLSHVLAFATTYMQTSGVSAGISSGFWMWLGFVAPVMLGTVLWEGKPWKLWAINSGYYLVVLCTMGVILTSWT